MSLWSFSSIFYFWIYIYILLKLRVFHKSERTRMHFHTLAIDVSLAFSSYYIRTIMSFFLACFFVTNIHAGPEAATGGFASGRHCTAPLASGRRKSTSSRRRKLRPCRLHQNRNGAVRARSEVGVECKRRRCRHPLHSGEGWRLQ